MNQPLVRYEERGAVALITYNRPETRNAWNVRMTREVMAAVERGNGSDTVGAIVITANGPVFCAGVDFKARPEPRDPETGIRPRVSTIGMADDKSWLHLLAHSKPSVIAVNGPAIGLGVTHTLAADIRIGAASSSYSFAFLERSTMPEFGCTALLPRLVGYGRAVDICLSAQTLTAPEALKIGLITRIAADDELLEQALALGERLAGFPAMAMGLTRRMLQANAAETDLNGMLKTERDAFVSLIKTARNRDRAATTIKPPN